MDSESREQSSGAQESDSAREDTARDGSTPGEATTPPTAATTMDDKSDNIDVWTPKVVENGLKRRREISEAPNGLATVEAHHSHTRETNAHEPHAPEPHAHDSSARWSQGAVNGSNFEYTPSKRTDRVASADQGAFQFLASDHTACSPRFATHRPSTDPRTSVKPTTESDPLHIASIEPQLVDIMVQIWHLRTYIRRRRSGETDSWWDHVIINDAFGIDQAIAKWTPAHAPGSLQYPASMLYKQAVWIYFNRTIQPSRPSTAFKQVVDDGLHYLKSLPPDQTALLMPLTLLGIAAFDEVQRAHVQVEIMRFQTSVSGALLEHIEGVCGRLWMAVDARNEAASWDWEHISETYYSHSLRVEDAFLADILGLPTLADRTGPKQDPMDIDEPSNTVNGSGQRESPLVTRASVNLLAIVKQSDAANEQMEGVEQRPAKAESAGPYHHRLTASTSSASVGTPNNVSRPSGATDPYIPGWRSYESRRLPEPIAIGPPQRNSFPQSYTTSYAHTHPLTPRDSFPIPRPRTSRITPPESLGAGSPMEHSHDLTRRHSVYSQSVFSTTMGDAASDDENGSAPPRKIARSRAKAPLPPCNMCGKRFKNPSDEQKHRLQHEKPFRCEEPGCTRTEGFATINDLQRHQVSVHRASLANARKTGYICAACPAPAEGQSRKFWPRRDNFKAHIRRKHQHWNESQLLDSSETGRPSEGETGYGSKPPRAGSPRPPSSMEAREIIADANDDGGDDEDDGGDDPGDDSRDDIRDEPAKEDGAIKADE